jgi:hypothetical protein
LLGLATLVLWLSLGLEVSLLGFPIALPINALAAVAAVSHKISFQNVLTPGTTVVKVIMGIPGEYGSILYLHGKAIRQHQLKSDRKISQSAGPLPLSDCHKLHSFSFVVSVYIQHCLGDWS